MEVGMEKFLNVGDKVIGKICCEFGKYFFKVRTDDEIVTIPQDDLAKKLAYSDEICILEVLESVEQTSAESTGKIIEVMGKEGDPIPEGLAIANVHSLINSISQEVLEQTDKIDCNIKPHEFKLNKDLTKTKFITIDPDGAKDFDDAVYAKKNVDGSYTLMVAIANVSNYIPTNSPLFEHAMERGNSTYLGGTVYPMLPENLSNGICSLNENCDRLAMTTTINIAPSGEILSYTIEPSIINSHHRLTYKEVDHIHFGMSQTGEESPKFKGLTAKTLNVKESIDTLFELSDILEKQKINRGALDISSRLSNFILDKSGTKIMHIEKEKSEKSTKVIESTAVLANEVWADACERMNIPFVYRNHQTIDDENEGKLSNKLSTFNLSLPENPSGHDIQKIIKQVRGEKIEEVVVSLILKAMQEAYYSTANAGHMGLGIADVSEFQMFDNSNEEVDTDKVIDGARREYLKHNGSYNGLHFQGDISHMAYGHTTSPIRRGADLLNQHQMLNVIYQGNPKFDKATLNKLCANLNKNERNSCEAEMEYYKLLSSLWVKDHIGEVYKGIITSFGKHELQILTDDCLKFNVRYSELNRQISPNNIKSLMNYKKVKGGMNLGDELTVKVYCVSNWPPKIYATEHLEKELDDQQTVFSEANASVFRNAKIENYCM